MEDHIFSAHPTCPHCGTSFEFSARMRELPKRDLRSYGDRRVVAGPITRWIKQRLVFMEGARTTLAELQADYNAWADAHDCQHAATRTIGDRLVEHGYQRMRSTMGVRCIANVAICADAIGTPELEATDDPPEPPPAPQPPLVERWAAECVVRAPGKFVSAKDLKRSHQEWAAANCVVPVSMRAINEHLSNWSGCLRSLGLGGVPGIVGVRLRDPALDDLL